MLKDICLQKIVHQTRCVQWHLISNQISTNTFIQSLRLTTAGSSRSFGEIYKYSYNTSSREGVCKIHETDAAATSRRWTVKKSIAVVR